MTFIITLLQFSITFTFQYGSNQIEVGGVEVTGNGRFTFQYGSNQITPSKNVATSQLLFTFQYGSNQMISRRSAYKNARRIYIPIWF